MSSLLPILASAVSLVAPPQAPPIAPAAANAPRHRLRLVRATNQTPIGGAELFDADFDERGVSFTFSTFQIFDAEREFPRRAHRHVADDDGFVEIGPGRRHALLARAPGWFQLRTYFDCARERISTLELIPDEPLTIELRGANDEPVEGAFVELASIDACGCGPHTNSKWRVASDRKGCVSFPHYRWWMSDDLVGWDHRLDLAIPTRDPPSFELRPVASPFAIGTSAALASSPPSVVWQLPPLSTVHIEFEGMELLPAPRAVTFELIGPRQIFGEPDRFVSRDGASLDLLAEVGVPFQARFRWDEDDRRRPAAQRFALGLADAHEGGVTRLHLSIASDLVALRLRPVRGDGAPLAAIDGPFARADFEVSVDWKDSRGIDWRDLFCGLVADETGAVRFDWLRPRLAIEAPPATIRIAVRPSWHRYGWEPLQEDALAARDLPWPTASELDVGTLIVPSAK